MQAVVGQGPEIDAKIKRLVEELNAFEVVATLGSCGGHPVQLKGGQWHEDSWYVTFKLRHDAHGWRALEFLAWLINHDYVRGEPRVRLYPDSVPPYLNTPGSTLKFALDGCEVASANALAWFGLMPVVPMTLIAAALMVVVSLLTRPPARETLARFGLV